MEQTIHSGALLLLAKMSGKTSFDTLWDVKHALGTRKIGHTGTLDSFADGLLVVLSGNLTRLVDAITAADKEYRAIFTFGKRTDTLDPTGTITETAPLPSLATLRNVLPQFTGSIMQQPPEFSAVHVNGRRASDCARKGRDVVLPFRPITVSTLELVSADVDSLGGVTAAEFRIVCSKGTYVRSLARDIGIACGSASFVQHLRRTRVGCYRLEDAALCSYLPPFASGEMAKMPERESVHSEITTAARVFCPSDATTAGLCPVVLTSSDATSSFMHGKVIDRSWFASFENRTSEFFLRDCDAEQVQKMAVFTPDETFRGVVQCNGRQWSYDFVVPAEPSI